MIVAIKRLPCLTCRWACHGHALIAKLNAEIDAEADDAASLSHTEREKRESEVQQDLLAVERDEAALVWTAQAEGG